MKRNNKILVVDDDENQRITLEEILTLMGYPTTIAGTGAEAVAAADRDVFSLALIDLKLPDMDGIEVMARIKEISPLTAVIVLTGHASTDTAIEATRQGAYSYLLKPYEMQDLLRSIGHGVERHQAQEQILRLASFPRLHPSPVIELNPAGEVTYANPAAEKAFPQLNEMGLRHPLLSGLAGPIADLRRSASQGAISHVAELDGATYELQISYARDVNLIRIYVADITERMRLAEELDRHRHHLEQLVEKRTAQLAEARDKAHTATLAKSTFVANMSHEIRTPMNAILGMAHLMRRDGVTPKQAEQLDKMDAAAEHLLHVINDILDLSKIEAGKLSLEDKNIVLGSLLNNVASILSTRVSAKGLQLVLDAEHLPHHLCGDPTRLMQALLNYANNAVKFTDKGTITIRARVQEEAEGRVLLRFEVEDTGVGIASEQLGRLFSAFEQADSSTTREHGGTGLGLAITKRLAQIMGGDAGLSSVPGKGSTFWFTAWLRKTATIPDTTLRTSPDEMPEAILARDHHGRRVLLAEDEPLNQEIAVELLRETGLLIEVAENGAQAVEMAEHQAYDVILMDMQMRKMDGLEATRRLRRMPAGETVPILAMTANAFAEDRQRCIDAGMNDFLAKPVKPDELYAMLVKWLVKTNSRPPP